MLRKLRKSNIFKYAFNEIPENVKAEIREENRKFAVIWSCAHILYWSYCLFMSTRLHDFLVCRPIYAVALAVCAAALLLALFAVPRIPWLIQLVAFAVDAAFLGAGVAIALRLAPKTIIVFASVLTVPVLFISDLLTPTILLTVDIIVFAIIGKSAMEPSAYSWVLPNMIIFSSIGLIMGYFVNKARYERYLFADSAAKLAELQTRYAYFDQMTGLQNRRAYSELTDRYALEMPAYCCLIMVDINGLKQINDRLGHEAGDELIIGSAECLRQGFKETDAVYRIGGDEFCILLLDTDIDTGQRLKQIEECCARWKGKYVNGISLSYGYADSKEFSDFNSIQKATDQRMYQFKRQYYQNSGTDRRRR